METLKQLTPYEERSGLSENSKYSYRTWIFSRFHFSLWFLSALLRLGSGLTVLVKQNLVTSAKENPWQRNQGKLKLLTRAARK